MARRTIAGMRTILTGVSAGIGQELAHELARRGARLILNARREDRLQRLCEELRTAGGEVFPVPGDVVEPAVRQQLVAAAQQHFGGLDCLINNAGMSGIGRFDQSDEARLRRIMEVNFFAPVELARLAIPELRRGTKPLIVNVASVLAHVAVPKKTEYCASKFALHGFSDALRVELFDDKIDVMILSPSTTKTEIFDVALGDKRELKWLNYGGQSPLAVARAAVRAMQQGRDEIILTPGGKALVWFDRLFPWLTARLIRRFGQ